MTIGRVTQNMLSQQSLGGMQAGLGRLARLQEQLSTGRLINRPSDDPSGAAAAMRLHAAVPQQRQYARNADDGRGWLDQVDSTLGSMTDQVRVARELGLQGANSGAVGSQGREALAVQVDQVLEGLVASANTTYLGRPVFGGITAGSTAYNPDGTYAGVPGQVLRTVADGVKVRVDVDGPAAFGPDGDSVFDHLAALSVALRAGDQAGITAAINVLGTDGERITNTRAEAGARAARIEAAKGAAEDADISLSSRLSEIENTDLAAATVDLKMQEVAYQAALAATARVMQPSLIDFLR
jgi:flagellar hook-associated protein 3 FlgL